MVAVRSLNFVGHISVQHTKITGL